MAASGYTPWSVVVGEQPTTTKWNILGSNDAAFYSGNGINDQAIVWRHLQSDMIFTGAIQWAAIATPPSSNWLLCDGSAISRTVYAPLFAAIGTQYGTGDGSSTFNLPNLKGRVPVGRTDGDGNFQALGQTGGEDAHTLSWDEMPVHSHGVNDPGHNHSVGKFGTSGTGYGLVDSQHSVSSGTGFTSSNGTGIWLGNAGSGWGHNNLQPYITLNAFIKI